MGVEATLVFQPMGWNDEAEAAFRPIVEPHAWADFVGAVQRKESSVWRVSGKGWHSWLATRVDQFASGHCRLVVELLAGSHSREILAELKSRAKAMGADSMSFETLHDESVISRLVAPVGLQRAASIFTVNL